MFSFNYGPGELIFMWPVLGVAYNVNTDWRGWQDQEARSDITFQKSPSGLIGGEPQRSRDKKKKAFAAIWNSGAFKLTFQPKI